MCSCRCSKVYESEDIRLVTGDTLRPGGFILTDRAMNFCHFPKEKKILDVGCGIGTTVEYLSTAYRVNAIGIDPSENLLQKGKIRNSKIKIYKGQGENLPFLDHEMDGVFAECTLSLMEDVDTTISEISRILKEKGYFIMTDVYARNPEWISQLRNFSIESCIRGVWDIQELKNKLTREGFNILLCEDHTNLLKQLVMKIIFIHGSMSVFWNKTTNCSGNFDDFQEILSKCKTGYFLMIAQKS